MIDFLSQGGYAFYVWASYGLALVLLVAEILHLRRQRRTILARLGRLVRLFQSTPGLIRREKPPTA